jgi:hypothetical protein
MAVIGLTAAPAVASFGIDDRLVVRALDATCGEPVPLNAMRRRYETEDAGAPTGEAS